MLNTLKNWYMEVSKPWLFVFAFFFISTIAYCLIGIPAMRSGADKLPYKIWGLASFILCSFTWIKLIQPIIKKNVKWEKHTYPEMMRIFRGYILFDIIVVLVSFGFMLFTAVGGPKTSTDFIISSFLFMSSCLLLIIDVVMMLAVFFENKLEKHTQKKSII